MIFCDNFEICLWVVFKHEYADYILLKEYSFVVVMQIGIDVDLLCCIPHIDYIVFGFMLGGLQLVKLLMVIEIGYQEGRSSHALVLWNKLEGSVYSLTFNSLLFVVIKVFVSGIVEPGENYQRTEKAVNQQLGLFQVCVVDDRKEYQYASAAEAVVIGDVILIFVICHKIYQQERNEQDIPCGLPCQHGKEAYGDKHFQYEDKLLLCKGLTYYIHWIFYNSNDSSQEAENE